MMDKLIESKIVKKQNGAKISKLEESIASAYIEMEMSSEQTRSELRGLKFISATELNLDDNRKAVVIRFPVSQLKAYREIMTKLVHDFEKHFNGKKVVFIAHRTVIPKPRRGTLAPERPYKKTLKSVQEELLNDLVYPNEIVGKRIRYRAGKSPILKVFLKKKTDYSAADLSIIYKGLTSRNAEFIMNYNNVPDLSS